MSPPACKVKKEPDSKGEILVRWLNSGGLDKTYWIQPGQHQLDMVGLKAIVAVVHLEKRRDSSGGNARGGGLRMPLQERRDLVWLMEQRLGEGYLERERLRGGGDSSEDEDDDDVPLNEVRRRALESDVDTDDEPLANKARRS